MSKVDLKKDLKALYASGASATDPALIEVPRLHYLMIDGEGDPNTSQAYQDALGALYSVAYTMKFDRKHRSVEPDFTVMPLEGLWWMKDDSDFDQTAKDDWAWTAMIVQPEFIAPAEVERAVGLAAEKKPLQALEQIRLEALEEGLSGQILHIGPYADEAPTIERLHAFISDEGRRPRGRHHEIYLSDPRRTAPEKLKTIIRQPVE
jgi:hypothetical protein